MKRKLKKKKSDKISGNFFGKPFILFDSLENEQIIENKALTFYLYRNLRGFLINNPKKS